MSLVVMAHPSRITRALCLKADLRAAAVVPDPLPHGEPNALRTARCAWVAAARIDKWAAVFQDDALPCPGLTSSVVEQVWLDARQALGGRLCAVSLYYGRQSRTGERMCQHTDRGFVGKPEGEYLATVAAIVPTAWVRGWLAWSHNPRWHDDTRDDECWGAYLDYMGYPAVATVPCLVDHDNTIPSVAGNHEHGARYAAVPPPQETPSWFT